MASNDRYFLGDQEIALDSDEAQQTLVRRLRQYLELRNVAVLIGNGCSLPSGAPSIANIGSFRGELESNPYQLLDAARQTQAIGLLDHLLSNGLQIGLEALLAVLASLRATVSVLGKPLTVNTRVIVAEEVAALESLLKKWLYERCRALAPQDSKGLRYHEELLRRLMLRSTMLPRCKLFTTNYDLLIEMALDRLGVLYFDGFLGTLDRTLRTESYHYDLYYPGETTEGRVSRVDRVLHLYKLHGSINWRRRPAHGLDVALSHTRPTDQEYGDVMTYPSPLKLTEMNGYPYSEMFRHFSAQIHQPQAVLFAIGYSFADDHINRLIYQALSIPSFSLIIVLPEFPVSAPGQPLRAEHEVWRLISELRSKRILVLTGGEPSGHGGYASGAGTLQDFSTKWMPDIRELDVEAGARQDSARALAPTSADAPDGTESGDAG